MKYLIGILGLLVVFGLAYLASNNRKEIKYRPIVIMVVIQLLLSALLLNTKFGLIIINAIASVFESCFHTQMKA